MAWRRSSVRARLAPSPRGRPDGRPRLRCAGLLADGALRGLAPELLEPVEVARLRREDVDDDVEVVHEDPARLADALDAARQQALVLLEAQVDAVVDGLRLTVGRAGDDDEEVGVARHLAQVEHDDVGSLLVRRVGRGGGGEPLGAHGHAAGLPAGWRYSERARIASTTESGTRYRIGRPAATRSRIAEDDRSMRGMSKNTTRSPACSGSNRWAMSSRRRPSRSATARRASSRTAAGSRQDGRL